MKNKLIPKHQLGGPIAGLSQQKSRGSWGNRGQGNEGESLLENGLVNTIQFIGDISGLTDVYNGLFNNQSEPKGRPEIINGQQVYELKQPTTEYGAPKLIPGLKGVPTETMKEVFKNWQRAYDSLAATKSRLFKLGRSAELTNSKPYKFFEQINKELAKLVEKANKAPKLKDSEAFTKLVKVQEETGQLGRLTGRSGRITYKGDVTSATNDFRHMNAGRPATKRAMDYIETTVRGWSHQSPVVQKALQKYDLKVAKGLDKNALHNARIEMIQTILKHSPGYFDKYRNLF